MVLKKSKIRWKKIAMFVVVIFVCFLIFVYKKNSFQIFTADYFQDKYSNHLSSDQGFEYLKYCEEESKLCSFLPHQSFVSDIIWLRGIQHAGQTDFFTYDEKLYYELQTITNISPYWKFPYIFTQLLLPLQKHSFVNNEETTKELERKSWKQAVEIGEKGIDFLCNINFGLKECEDYQISQSLAFTYFYYLNNLDKAKEYYELASNSKNAPPFLKNMSAIIEGRIGNHLKSAVMWYEKFLSELENNGDNSEYFIQKSVFEYTLHLIEITDQSQDICIQDLLCLQENQFLQKTIEHEKKSCVEGYNQVAEISCMLLRYGLDNKFISLDGNFVYPLDAEEFIYGYRLDISDWWIVPVG